MLRVILFSLICICINRPALAMNGAGVEAQNRMIAMQSTILMLGIIGTSLTGLTNTATALVKELHNLYLWLKPATLEGIKSELRINGSPDLSHINKRSELIFNDGTRRQIEAVFQKIAENARFNLSQESVLITGPAGTGKTSLAMSLAHDGFEVFIVSADELCLRERLVKLQAFARLLTEFSPRRVAIIVEESEVFFQCLSPAYTNLGSRARLELEAKFLSEFGTHGKAVFLWTSNSVKDLLSVLPKEAHVHHKSSGLLRRFRNIIQTSLPEEPTRRKLVLQSIQRRIAATSTCLEISADLLNGFSMGLPDRWNQATAGMSQDDLNVIAENIVARENLRNSSEIVLEDLLTAFEDQKSSSEAIQTASENEKKAELLRLEEQAQIVELRNKIEPTESHRAEKKKNQDD